jgi:hypothetical protein
MNNIITKKCSKCFNTKEISEFYKHSGRKDGHTSACKICINESVKNYQANNPEKFKLIRKKSQINYSEKNREILNNKQKQNRFNNPQLYIITRIKHNCKKNNIPFNLQEKDIIIPECCPVFGIKLEFNEGKFSDNSPSVDRLKPELGYIKGNIRVISYKANRLKSDAKIDDLEKVIEYMKMNNCN